MRWDWDIGNAFQTHPIVIPNLDLQEFYIFS